MNSTSRFAKSKLLALIIILCCSLLTSILQFHNGFPLLMSDSFGYLIRSFNQIENSHFSNTYGVFLSSTIWAFKSVQWITFMQNFITAIVLYIFCRTYIYKYNYVIFFTIILTLLFTTLPWFTNMLMSDIFTSITILCLILIIDNKVKKENYILLVPILFIGISAHQSHLLIVPVFTLCLIFIKCIEKDRKLSSIAMSFFAILALTLASNIFEKNIFNKEISSQNVIDKKASPDISSGYYFVAVRIAEAGELKYMLDHFCDNTQTNYLCSDSDAFNASRIKNVGYGERNPNNKEYVNYSSDNKEFVFFALTKPRFYLGVFRLIFKRGFTTLRNTKLRKYQRESKQRVKKYESIFVEINPKDLISFQESKQHENIYPNIISGVYSKIDKFWWFVLLPISFISIVVLTIKKDSDFVVKNKNILLFLILGHILNTLICGTFSNFEQLRYSTRTLWLVNLVIIIILIQVIQYLTDRKLRHTA